MIIIFGLIMFVTIFVALPIVAKIAQNTFELIVIGAIRIYNKFAAPEQQIDENENVDMGVFALLLIIVAAWIVAVAYYG